MSDPIARKRLKKKMLERWENEGGKIATDTSTTDTGLTSGDSDRGKKLSATGDTKSPRKTRKPARK